MSLKHLTAGQRRRATREDRVVNDPNVPRFETADELNDYLGDLAEAEARKLAQLAMKDREWIAAYLRTFPDRVSSLEALVTHALKTRIPAADALSVHQMVKAEQRIRAIAEEVWEQYEAGRIQPEPYVAKKRDSRERSLIEAVLRGNPHKTREELINTAVQQLVTWNDRLSEGQRGIAAERVTAIANDVWRKAHANAGVDAHDDEEARPVEEPETAGDLPFKATQEYQGENAQAALHGPSDVLPDAAPSFVARDEHDRPVSVLLAEPTLAESQRMGCWQMHEDRPVDRFGCYQRTWMHYSELTRDQLQEVALEEYRRFTKHDTSGYGKGNESERYAWAMAFRNWRGAVVVLRHQGALQPAEDSR